MAVAVARNTLGLETNTTVSLFLSKPRTGRIHTRPLAQDDQNNKQTETKYSIGRATREGARFPTLFKPSKTAPSPANRSCIPLCSFAMKCPCRRRPIEGGGGGLWGWYHLRLLHRTLILAYVDDPHRLYRAAQTVPTGTTPPEMRHRHPTVAAPPSVSAMIKGPD